MKTIQYLDTETISTPDARIEATVYNSGFEHAYDSFNGVTSASDGRIYYILSSTLIDVAGQMYSFDPKTKIIEHLGDLTNACGEKNMKAVAQGKSHVNFVESNGKLYFATHGGYYNIVDGLEITGGLIDGFKEYQGGHILAFDIKNKTFEDLCIAPHKEGIITMNMDTTRGLIYGLTWPNGYLFRYDLAKKERTDFGPFTLKGEAGTMGNDFRVLCRSIAIDPRDGTAYLTNAEGQIKCIKVGQDSVEILEGENMKKDYFGSYDPSTTRGMAYNWRQTFWNASEKQIYGIHGNSGYLFSFDPLAPRIKILERLTSIPSRLTGMKDQFRFGYLGFQLGPDGRTIYYLTGAPVYIDGKQVLPTTPTDIAAAAPFEDLHLITYDLPTGRYLDHGGIFFPDGQRAQHVNSIAVGNDGTIYCTSRVTYEGKTRVDLISIPNPFKNGTWPAPASGALQN